MEDSTYSSFKKVITDTSSTTNLTALALSSCNLLMVGVGGGGACGLLRRRKGVCELAGSGSSGVHHLGGRGGVRRIF